MRQRQRCMLAQVYRLTPEGSWADKGTGHICVEYLEVSWHAWGEITPCAASACSTSHHAACAVRGGRGRQAGQSSCSVCLQLHTGLIGQLARLARRNSSSRRRRIDSSQHCSSSSSSSQHGSSNSCSAAGAAGTRAAAAAAAAVETSAAAFHHSSSRPCPSQPAVPSSARAVLSFMPLVCAAACGVQKADAHGLVVISEDNDGNTLLVHRISKEDIYHRTGGEHGP